MRTYTVLQVEDPQFTDQHRQTYFDCLVILHMMAPNARMTRLAEAWDGVRLNRMDRYRLHRRDAHLAQIDMVVFLIIAGIIDIIVAAICPHCKTQLEEVWYREMKGDLGKRCLYFCPHCKSVLGFSHRKGLTFGW